MLELEKNLNLVDQKLHSILGLPLFGFDQIPVKEKQFIDFLEKVEKVKTLNGLFEGFYNFDDIKEALRKKVNEAKSMLAGCR